MSDLTSNKYDPDTEKGKKAHEILKHMSDGFAGEGHDMVFDVLCTFILDWFEQLRKQEGGIPMIFSMLAILDRAAADKPIVPEVPKNKLN